MGGHSRYVVVLAGAVWLGSVPVAWPMFTRLVAMSVSRRYSWRSPRYLGLFVAYRLVILAPYAVLLLLGRGLPRGVVALMLGWVATAAVLSALRLIGPQLVTAFLWHTYGYVYDGLRSFYPYRNLTAVIAELTDARPGEVVLDLGCGTGNLIELIARVPGISVVGVDQSGPMLRRARRKLRVLAATGNLELVQDNVVDHLARRPANSCDKILMVNVLYAVQDRPRLWREALRVLTPNGVLVVTNSDRGGSKDIVKEHLANAPRRQLFDPRLLAVALVDRVINELARAQVFSFADSTTLFDEIAAAGGTATWRGRAYGDVNIVFTVGRQPVGPAHSADPPGAVAGGAAVESPG